MTVSAIHEAETAYRAKLAETPGASAEADGDLNCLVSLGHVIADSARVTGLIQTATGQKRTPTATICARLCDAIDGDYSVEAMAVIRAVATDAVEERE
jgi:hypothetical protein